MQALGNFIGGAFVPASLTPRVTGEFTNLDAGVAALATPTALASTVTATAEESPTLPRALVRDDRFMGGSLSVSKGGLSR